MTDVASTPVLAAGAVCWRLVNGKVRVLLVRRTQHRDVSLPKGKVDPGETLPETAVREIAEETGLVVGLGAPLGQVEYTIPSGREKIVYYWSAEVDAHALENAVFLPNDEISGLEWVTLKQARTRLSYPHDVDIVDAFAARIEAGQARTFAIVVVRHGKALPPGVWDGPDSTRPLLLRGTAQAASIAPGLAAFRPRKIISSTAARCLATVAPLARLVGIEVSESDAISQDAFENGRASVASVLAKRVKRRKNVVLCSHGPVIPVIIDELGRLTGTPSSPELRAMSDLATGDFSVLHVSFDHPAGGLVALETHSATAE